MKKSIIWLIGRALIVMVFSLYSLVLFSQERNLKSEILVFFMPDSLELPALAKNRVALTEATIRSKQLSVAVPETKPIGIAKAFPDWQNESKVSEGNKEIEAPPFDRIFILTFNTEAEADAAINILSKTNGVVFAEKHSQPTVDNDVHYINGDQWYLNNNGANGGVVGADINAEGAWAIYTGNTNNTIAIIDNGVEITHEDLSGKASGDTPVGYSHGTSVAGVAAARANNTLGIRGVDWNAQILSKRVRDSNDAWLGDNVAAQKITEAVNEGADVLNCSWSTPVNSSTLAVAFAYAYRANRVTVATMGNTGVQETRYPGALPNVMAVGATQNDDTHSPFSTTGTHIDVVAPGGIHPAGYTNEEDIITTTTNNNYLYTSGTSFAAPQVAGLASLLEGYNSNLDNDDIRQIIRISADDNIVPGHDNQYGFGRINAGRALEFLQAPNTLNKWTATGGTVFSSTGTYTAQFISAPGLSTANYLVKRYEVRKTITFPNSFLCVEGVWGRGVNTTGWNPSSPNFGEGFCEVVPGTQTNTSVTLRTHVYEIWSTGGSYLGYYPKSPSNVSFAYSVLGIPVPSISGPSSICSSGNTFTISNLPPVNSIVWEGGPGLYITSGQNTPTCTFSATGSASFVRATVVTTCGTTVSLPQKNVTAAMTASFTGNGTVLYGGSGKWTATASGCTGPYQYQWWLREATNPPMGAILVGGGNPLTLWSVPRSGLAKNPEQDLSEQVMLQPPTSTSYYLSVQAIDANGMMYYTPERLIVAYGDVDLINPIERMAEGGAGETSTLQMRISPNPATDEATVEISNTETQLLNEDNEWQVEIYDAMQLLKTKIQKIKGSKQTIRTTGWKEGVYIVRARIGNEVLSDKLIVKP